VNKYSRGPDELLLEEHPMDDLDHEDIRRLYRLPEDDSLYGSLPIGPDQRSYFEGVLGIRIDTDTFLYYLECYAEQAV
jgi:hypothetical protein